MFVGSPLRYSAIDLGSTALGGIMLLSVRKRPLVPSHVLWSSLLQDDLPALLRPDLEREIDFASHVHIFGKSRTGGQGAVWCRTRSKALWACRGGLVTNFRPASH